VNSAILVAAGKGARMGAGVDKLFLEVAGRPVVAHTWRRFDEAPCIGEIILVVRRGRQNTFAKLAAEYHFQKPFRVVIGGAERQDSVWNGLQALSAASEIVAIHDAARPCASGELIAATVRAAEENGAAVAAQPVTDTIKESADGRFIQRTLDRSRLWSVQTPQTFRVEVIRRALTEVRHRGLIFTDDTAACELIGQPVRLV
jgi:2-C-methyl-D-erythritol 4-phosphate cytidylyltransferase